MTISAPVFSTRLMLPSPMPWSMMRTIKKGSDRSIITSRTIISGAMMASRRYGLRYAATWRIGLMAGGCLVWSIGAGEEHGLSRGAGGYPATNGTICQGGNDRSIPPPGRRRRGWALAGPQAAGPTVANGGIKTVTKHSPVLARLRPVGYNPGGGEENVQPEVEARLLAINRSFYEQLAKPFADSRETTQASVRRVLTLAGQGSRVLDVGCGDGRAARALDELEQDVDYTGADASEALIAQARQRAAGLRHCRAEFHVVDITTDNWAPLDGTARFDLALCLAVIHHLPGRHRQRIVTRMGGVLAPAGRLVVSTWQFMSSARLRRKLVPWELVGLDDSQVDDGDYLIDWKRGGYGLRYCHLVSAGEMAALIEEVGLIVEEMYLADNGLNLYAVARWPG